MSSKVQLQGMKPLEAKNLLNNTTQHIDLRAFFLTPGTNGQLIRYFGVTRSAFARRRGGDGFEFLPNIELLLKMLNKGFYC